MKRYIKASKVTELSLGMKSIVGQTWKKLIKEIYDNTEFKVDSSSTEYPEQFIVLYDPDGNEYEAEVTKYSNGQYELLVDNIHEVHNISSSIKAATEFADLESYVGLPFDLSDDEVQYKIAEWASNKLIETLKNTKGFKRRKFFIDDLSWSSSQIYFLVYEELKNKDFDDFPAWQFRSKLNFYDGPSEDYSDVEYLIDDEIKEFMYSV